MGPFSPKFPVVWVLRLAWQSVLDRLPLKQGAGQKTPDEVMRLRDALERAQDLITVLKNRLEQKDAAIDMLKITYEEEVRSLAGHGTGGWRTARRASTVIF